jgi:CHASE2 domain-containing sensor protein
VDTADERGGQQIEWLRPLPQIERAAAGLGHVQISTESDGTARELPLRKMDNDGRALWSLAVEAVRVGDGLSESDVQDSQGAVRLGRRTLLLADDADKLNVAPPDQNERVINLRADRMVIDYVGAPGAFAARTYSFADILDGKVPPERLRGKYVLVGATAATLGDHVASPFVHREGLDKISTAR